MDEGIFLARRKVSYQTSINGVGGLAKTFIARSTPLHHDDNSTTTTARTASLALLLHDDLTRPLCHRHDDATEPPRCRRCGLLDSLLVMLWHCPMAHKFQRVVTALPTGTQPLPVQLRHCPMAHTIAFIASCFRIR